MPRHLAQASAWGTEHLKSWPCAGGAGQGVAGVVSWGRKWWWGEPVA